MILVTGGAGFLGSRTTRRLVARGESVRVLVHSRERAEKRGRLDGLDVDLMEGDVTRPNTLNAAFSGVQAVVHTAAIAVEKGDLTYEKVNFEGTVNVVDGAQEAGVRRFVNICQLGAQADLPYRFLASKGRAQDYVAASGLEWTALRPSVLWGPEDEFANTFARLAPLTPLIFPRIGGEDAKFQPVWVEDVVTFIVGALDDPDTFSEEYELAGPEVLTLGEIESRTLQAVGARRVMVSLPMPVMKAIVAVMEKALPAPPVTRSLLELLGVANYATDNAIYRFVPDPRPMTPENMRPYMGEFTVGETLAKYLGRE